MTKADAITTEKRSRTAAITRRHKRVLRKLLFLECNPGRAGPASGHLTRLMNFNRELIDALKVAGLIELSAHITDGRLDWHVRLTATGSDMARQLGAMKPVNPARSAALLEYTSAGRPDSSTAEDPTTLP